MVLFGTTGEGPSFSIAERKQCLQALIQQGVSARKIILGAICTAVPDVIELAQTALSTGCVAVLVAPPYYFPGVSEEGVVAFYRYIILRVGDPKLRLLLYHIPHFTRMPITLPILRQLVEEFPDQVIGVKESDGNTKLSAAILNGFPKLQLFVGNELDLPTVAQLGGSGAICGLANVYPELVCALYEQGKDSLQPDCYEEAVAIVSAIRGPSFVSALRSIMANSKGNAWLHIRPPLTIKMP